MLATLDALVMFGAEDGTFGTGCLREITDAIVVGLSIALLEAGSLRELLGLDLGLGNRRTRACAAWAVAGDPVTWNHALAFFKSS